MTLNKVKSWAKTPLEHSVESIVEAYPSQPGHPSVVTRSEDNLSIVNPPRQRTVDGYRDFEFMARVLGPKREAGRQVVAEIAFEEDTRVNKSPNHTFVFTFRQNHTVERMIINNDTDEEYMVSQLDTDQLAWLGRLLIKWRALNPPAPRS